jgi:hypothetical protein
MKPLLILLLMILLPGLAIAGKAELPQKSPAASPVANTPESLIKDFYRWYIGRLNQNKDPLRKEKAALGKYLTPEFLRKAPKLFDENNADIFICAQDWDKDWGNNVSVSKLNIQGTTATATVRLSGKTMNHKLKVTLKQLGGSWKINKIEPLDL